MCRIGCDCCCARATAGHAAAPPITLKKSRLRTSAPGSRDGIVPAQASTLVEAKTSFATATRDASPCLGHLRLEAPKDCLIPMYAAFHDGPDALCVRAYFASVNCNFWEFRFFRRSIHCGLNPRLGNRKCSLPLSRLKPFGSNTPLLRTPTQIRSSAHQCVLHKRTRPDDPD